MYVLITVVRFVVYKKYCYPCREGLYYYVNMFTFVFLVLIKHNSHETYKFVF